MFTARDRTEEFKFYLPLYLVFAKIRGPNLDLVPFEASAFWSLDFRFVDRSVLSRRDVPINDEEAKATIREGANWVENDNFCISCRLHFFRRYNDAACLASRKFRINKRFCHDLIASCHNLVKGKLINAYVVMAVNFPRLVCVII